MYGDALVKLGKSYGRIIALDGDTKNSTFSLTYKNAFPDRYVECFIAEQNLCGIGIGLACRDRNVVFCSTFAAFFTRAFDQIRMGAISQTQVNFVGSHAGCSIGTFVYLVRKTVFHSFVLCTCCIDTYYYKARTHMYTSTCVHMHTHNTYTHR